MFKDGRKKLERHWEETSENNIAIKNVKCKKLKKVRAYVKMRISSQLWTYYAGFRRFAEERDTCKVKYRDTSTKNRAYKPNNKIRNPERKGTGHITLHYRSLSDDLPYSSPWRVKWSL